MKLRFKTVDKFDLLFIKNICNKSCLPSSKINLSLERILKGNDIKIIISDNIRIGLLKENNDYSKQLVFINPYAFSHRLIDREYLNKLGLERVALNRFNQKKIYQENLLLLDKDERSDISPNISVNNILQKNLNEYSNSVLILGPLERNLSIAGYIEKKGFRCEIQDHRLISSADLKQKYNLILSSGYAYKVPGEIIDIYENRIFNLHATFLPWGKGIGTTLFAFLLNQPTGVSIHKIDKNIDTGDLLFRKLIEPSVEDTTRTFFSRLLEEVNLIFYEAWDSLISQNFVSVNQKNYSVSPPYFSRIDFENLIDFLPEGYDTKLFDLSVFGEIESMNNKFLNYLLYNK